MARLTNKEFAARAGMPPKNLYTYLGRKEIIKEDGFYDTESPENKAFLEKRGAKNDIPVVVSPEIEVIPAKKQGKKGQIIPEIGTESAYKRALLRSKDVDIEKKEREIERLNLEIAKKKGEVVPVAPVMMIVKGLSHSILLAMKNTLEHTLTDFAHKYSISAEDVAATRGQWIADLNKAVAAGVNNTAKNVDIIINEHSDRRTAGQSKN